MKVLKCVKLPPESFIFGDCCESRELFTVGKLYPVIPTMKRYNDLYTIDNYIESDLGDEYVFTASYLMLWFGDCFEVYEGELDDSNGTWEVLRPLYDI